MPLNFVNYTIVGINIDAPMSKQNFSIQRRRIAVYVEVGNSWSRPVVYYIRLIPHVSYLTGRNLHLMKGALIFRIITENRYLILS